ncbi:hypothetical protein [uncultured Mediterranean phage]|nr:hypothetical protein [uncultured Mediterranean phage]
MVVRLTILFVLVSFLSFGQGATPNLRSGLVGYWKCESVSNFLDETNNSYDGTIYSSPTSVTGKVGNAVNFDGSTDYIDVDNSGAFQFDDEFSVSLWFNADATGSIMTIFDNCTGQQGYGIRVHSDATIMGYEYSGSWNTVTSSTTVSTSTWYHAVLVYDYNTDFRIYVDGTSEDSNVPSGTVTYVGANGQIGARYHPTLGNGLWFDGKIDEILVYNRALSSIEVKQLYNSGDGLLYVQENFKKNKDYNKLIKHVLQRTYFVWIN